MTHTYTETQLAHIHSITDVIGDKYSLLILYELTLFGKKSFNELKRTTHSNAVTLARKLKRLKQQKLIDCKQHGLENHYFITPQVKEYEPILRVMETLVRNKGA